MKRLYLDTRTERKQAWRVLGFRCFSWTRHDGCEEPWFLLIHGSDLKRAMGPNSRKPVSGQNVAAFENWIRGMHASSAILYFSGGGDPWPLYFATQPRPGSVLSHVWTEAVDPIQPVSFRAFGAGLERILAAWKRAPGNAPKWELLRRDWLAEAFDALVALQLSNVPNSSGQNAELFEEVTINSVKVDLSFSDEQCAALCDVGKLSSINVASERQRAVQTALGVLSSLHDAGRRAPIREDPTEFERDRARISHTLFENEFGALLVPGWVDDRMSKRDIVLQALMGDADSLATLRAAIDCWREKVFPALEGLVARIEGDPGLERTAEWSAAVERLRAADAVIRDGVGAGERSHGAAKAEAKRFWVACDEAKGVIRCLHDHAGRMFRSWQGGPER